MTINEFENFDYTSFEDNFSIANKCSQMLTNPSPTKYLLNKIVLNILENWNKVPSEIKPIWTDIIESLGFYPYIQKNKSTMPITSFSDKIRQQYFSSDFLNEIYMHKEQKRLSNYLLSGKNVIASAPTSFGKSLLIEEIVASKKYKNIIIIQPTLALLDETRLKLKKYDDFYKIIVRTTQKYSNEKGNLFLLTAERVMEYENLPQIDFLVIDEFYKLSLRRKDERADILNNAFLKIIQNFNSKFYFLGPNIDGISNGFAEKYNAIFYKSDFSLVDCNIIDMTDKIDFSKAGRILDKEKCNILYPLLYSLRQEQTLIYCATPARARRFARGYIDYLKDKNVTPSRKLPLIEWIDENVSKQWSLSKELSYGVAIHDGSLQKHIGSSIINYFNSGMLDSIFCTSTIIEGVNTSAKNVILFDSTKGSKDLDFFDYNNIKGRSGRLMKHYIGKIYNFIKPPSKESIIIDIPFFEQNPISDEILINLPQNTVHSQHLDRYIKLNSIEKNLLSIIKKNGLSIKGQLEIYNILESNILQNLQLNNIIWSQQPNWNQLNFILSLAENRLFSLDKNLIQSTRQLALYLDKYRKSKNMLDIVNILYNHKIKDKSSDTIEKNKYKYFDESIEQAFHIYRHWFQFTIPKVFRVIDSLQRYLCEKYNLTAGSYSFFVQQLENDFVSENLSILIEYGIPTSAVRKLEKQIPQNLSEDFIIPYIKNNKDILYKSLIQYEIDKLNYCL